MRFHKSRYARPHVQINRRNLELGTLNRGIIDKQNGGMRLSCQDRAWRDYEGHSRKQMGGTRAMIQITVGNGNSNGPIREYGKQERPYAAHKQHHRQDEADSRQRQSPEHSSLTAHAFPAIHLVLMDTILLRQTTETLHASSAPIHSVNREGLRSRSQMKGREGGARINDTEEGTARYLNVTARRTEYECRRRGADSGDVTGSPG